MLPGPPCSQRQYPRGKEGYRPKRVDGWVILRNSTPDKLHKHNVLLAVSTRYVSVSTSAQSLKLRHRPFTPPPPSANRNPRTPSASTLTRTRIAAHAGSCYPPANGGRMSTSRAPSSGTSDPGTARTPSTSTLERARIAANAGPYRRTRSANTSSSVGAVIDASSAAAASAAAAKTGPAPSTPTPHHQAQHPQHPQRTTPPPHQRDAARFRNVRRSSPAVARS